MCESIGHRLIDPFGAAAQKQKEDQREREREIDVDDEVDATDGPIGRNDDTTRKRGRSFPLTTTRNTYSG